MQGKKIACWLARGAASLAPGALGVVLFAILSGPLAGTAAPDEGGKGVPPVCVGWHRGDGESRAFNLSRTEQGYRDFKESVAQSLSKSLKEHSGKASPAGYDAGLAACTRGETRRLTPAAPAPETLRGRRLWFFAVAGGRNPRVPEAVRSDPDVVPLASKIEKLEDLTRLSNLIGRPVSLAPRGLGEALGVHCVPALVMVSKEGEVEIHEDP